MRYPGEDMFPLGSVWTVKDTPTNMRNGLSAGKRAWLSFGDATHFTMTVDGPAMGQWKVPRNMLGANFVRDPLMPLAPAYISSRHAQRLFR